MFLTCAESFRVYYDCEVRVLIHVCFLSTGRGKDPKETHVEELKQKEDIFLQDVSSTRTDFSGTESYQKVVRFSRDGTRLVTGGAEGVVRVWKVSVTRKG